MSDVDAKGETRNFAWGYFATIVIGTIVVITVICTLATVLPKGTA